MILRGERRLTLDHITRLAKYFHVSPALFLE
jgi:antitoxin component HigA of HigAB toxin-antitoxin module